MTFYENAFEAGAGLVRRGVRDRQRTLRSETEDFLRVLSEEYATRRAQYWQWDYSSPEAYHDSVEGNRRRWLEAVGEFGPAAEAMAVETEPFCENDRFRAEWVTITHHGRMRGRAVLALPRSAKGPVPVVICQHGIGSSPERVFGFDDEDQVYHAYGQRVAEAGYAVLAPMNITQADPRARYHRLCLMQGRTLWGLEIAKIRRFIDYLATRPEIDTRRIAMWGISLGGAYTQFTMPIEPRIGVGISTAWFNDRVRKMAIDDPRYSCFLSVKEEHIFIPGWLREFSDSDLLSLVCPRPFQIQTGKADSIAWWPFVEEEFDRLKEHYSRLGVEDRLEWDLHEGGHEIRCETGLAFLRRWL
jgi:dienelactone hydrolase